MNEFEIGTKVIDLDGFRGVVRNVTRYNGSVWYDVRFERGEAVRYPSDLKVEV
jgi:hypothetical protein